MDGELEKELARQMEALRIAGLKRRQSDKISGVPPTVNAADVDEDDDNDEFDEDEDELPFRVV
jgi:hypothetical protein